MIIDKYIPDDVYKLLSSILPYELINIILLKICDKIVIKYNNNNFQFINPYTKVVLKTQQHNIDNYYYIYPSLGILDIIWDNNNVRLYNNFTNYNTIIDL